MTNCGTCNGTGYVIWKQRRLICTDCDGRGETHLVPKNSYAVVLAMQRKRIMK